MVAREGELAGSLGYVRSSVQVLGSLLGDGQARLRLLEVYEPWQLVAALQPLALHLPAGQAPQRMCVLILPPEQRPPGHWIENWNDWDFERMTGRRRTGRSRGGPVTCTADGACTTAGTTTASRGRSRPAASSRRAAAARSTSAARRARCTCSRRKTRGGCKASRTSSSSGGAKQRRPDERPPRPTTPSGVWLGMPSRGARPSASSTTSSSAVKFSGIRQSRKRQSSARRADSSRNGTGATARRDKWPRGGRSAHVRARGAPNPAGAAGPPTPRGMVVECRGSHHDAHTRRQRSDRRPDGLTRRVHVMGGGGRGRAAVRRRRTAVGERAPLRARPRPFDPHGLRTRRRERRSPPASRRRDRRRRASRHGHRRSRT